MAESSKTIPHHWNTGTNAIVVGSGKAVEAVTTALQQSGAKTVSASHTNMADEQKVAEQFDAAEQQLQGKIDILVFADALTDGSPVSQLSLNQWHQTTQINMDSRFFCAAELARRCLAHKRAGSILHLVSKAAHNAETGTSPAAASAGGIINLSMSLATEWGRDNIRSNVICTRLLDQVSDNDQQQLASLGALAAYYCSSYAAYITGSCVGVDEL